MKCELQDAIRKGDVACLERLLDSGIDIEFKMEYDQLTPLLIAVKHSKEVVEFLLKRGADIHARVLYCRNTPLHIAAYNKDIKMVELLLKFGANPLLTNAYASSPFHEAVRVNSIDIVRLLLREGSFIDSIANGMTAISHAVHYNKPNMVKCLLEENADVFTARPYWAKKKDNHDPKILMILLNHLKSIQSEFHVVRDLEQIECLLKG